MGPAGSIVTDPNFGSRIVRVSDAKTDPQRIGDSLVTPSSSQQNPWNSTSTKFYIMNMGGRVILYDFDPSSMKVRQSEPVRLSWGGEPQFSYAQPGILYGLGSAFQQYDISNRRITTIHDPSSCVKLSPSDHGYYGAASANDQRLLGVFGPRQDDNYLVYIFDREKGCRWFNTQSGEIGGKWGPKGVISSSSHFGVHDARLSMSGKFVAIAGGGTGPILWEVDTMNVTLCSRQAPFFCGGHHALGYSHMVNPSLRKHPLDLVSRPLDGLAEFSPLITRLPETKAWYDQHISWNNVNPEDTNPACFSTYRPDNPDAPGTPLKVTGPWENEIDCLEMDGKGSKVWRFAHTFSTAKNGFWSTPRGNVSPDGRFFMFTSDWQDQLGQVPNGKKYRTDAFIVELR
ncbi:MAG TPA: hypothetical protein VJK29_05660 [Terriglobales bacterium]|nr:hypothetical protein [Terriglobales bacterium]